MYGEVLSFYDSETYLPAIDRLEGFLLGGPSLYRRVLVPVKVDGTALPAWLDVVQPLRSDGRLLRLGSRLS